MTIVFTMTDKIISRECCFVKKIKIKGLNNRNH